MSSPDELDDVIREFLVEASEGLDLLDRELLVLEKEPGSREVLSRIFRAVHTIKGTAGCVGFVHLERLAHAGENVLGRLRDQTLVLTPAMANALLAMGDALRKSLSEIELTGTEGPSDHAALIAQFGSFEKDSEEGTARAPTSPEKPAVNRSEEPAAPSSSAGEVDASSKREDAIDKDTSSREVAAEVSGSSISDTSIRVDVKLLDKLMNLVGELVLARNQVLQFSSRLDDGTFSATSQHLNLVTTELQESVMKTRMQPIGHIWNKFPRVVRDLALTLGKRVTLEMEGQETELDRTIIEAIKDPLTHLVRNAVDHGIENPAQRQSAGKPAEGRLFLRAFHEGGQVNIEITDDGGGIDPERVKATALRRGVATADQLARMPDREILQLIFLPGFSTASAVTHVSGRGVGMDVVKTNIEKIGGTIDIQSEVGSGTSIKVKIPLTLAIIPALVVTSDGDRYAIPQVSLVELVRLDGEHAARGIEKIHGTPVYRLRGNLLPIVYLRETLHMEAAPRGDDALHIVVLQAGERSFGLVVDDIHDTEEIVVKPLGKLLKGLSVFAGATIMGDGRVALILDALGLAQRSGVISEVHDRILAEATSKSAPRAAEKQTMLLFGLRDGGRMALPLSSVSRLEEFPRERIEKAGADTVVQYRGEIMPLVVVSEALVERRRQPRGIAESEPQGTRDGNEKVQVVVHSVEGRHVGLVVDRILDIVEEAVTVRTAPPRPGTRGTAVIQGRVTELLDVDALMAIAPRTRRGKTPNARQASAS